MSQITLKSWTFATQNCSSLSIRACTYGFSCDFGALEYFESRPTRVEVLKMKYRFQMTSVFTALLVISSLQIPSSAQMLQSLSMATGMSKVQLNSMTNSLEKAYAQAMATAKTTTSVTTLSASISISADARYKCSAGGYIHTTMTTRSVTTSNTGNTTASGSGHQTISDWRCIKGWIVNGDPYISHTISSSMFAGSVRMSAHMSGGWKAIGPNKVKQSCQTSAESQYSSLGSSGFTTVHAKCVPGGTTDLTTHF